MSLAISPLETETLWLYTAGCYLGSFLVLVLEAGETSLRFRPHTSQEQPPSCCNILLDLQLPPVEPSQPSGVSALPTSHVVVKWFLLSVHGYKVSLHVVCSWLFRMLSLQFSCNSAFILGDG